MVCKCGHKLSLHLSSSKPIKISRCYAVVRARAPPVYCSCAMFEPRCEHRLKESDALKEERF